MTQWAIMVGGVVDRVSNLKSHPAALQVTYNPPDVDRVENDLAQKPMAEWIVRPDGVTATYSVTPRDLGAEKTRAKDKARAVYNDAKDGVSQALETAMIFVIDPDLESIDFDAGEWVTLSRAEAMDMGRDAVRIVQSSAAHCRALCDQIDAAETIGDVLAVSWSGGTRD